MITEAAVILESLAGGAKLAVRKATFVAVDAGMAIVDMGDSRFVADFGSGYIPAVGETVRIWSVGDQHYLFPAGPRPAVGTVVTTGGNVANLSTSAGNVSAAYFGTAPSSGDRVGIVWSEDGPWCTGKLSSTPAPPTPPPNPGGVGVVRSAIFRATDAGSTDRGSVRWWTGQPRAGDSTYGAWFYGTQIKDTIPANAKFVSMEMYISRTQDKGSAPNFALHNAPSKAGIPGYGSLFVWDPPNGWNTVPSGAWFTALIAGGPWWGVGLNQGGNNIFSSLVQDSMSGALRISWRS